MGKNNCNSITISKAIGIILMVIGHSGCPRVLFNFIYLFHMPLFFFCSGIFFNELNCHKTAMRFLKKRVIGLYFPFVKWSILFLFLHNLLMSVGIYNTSYGYEGGSSYYTFSEIVNKLICILFTMHGYEELLGGFWFIRALFVSIILIVVFSLLLKSVSKYKYELLCLLFLILTILIRRLAPDSEFWRDISMGTFGAFFYMLGHIVMRYSHYWHNKYGAIICCVLLILSFCYFRGGISMGCGFNKVLPFSISAISGTLLSIYVSSFIENNVSNIKKTLYYIGNHTLDILALHFLSFRVVSFIIVLLCGLDITHIAEHPVIKDVDFSIYNYWWCLYCIFGIVLPIIVTRLYYYIIRIIKTLRK